MGFEDTYHFDEKAYRMKARNLSPGELRKREIIKNRQQMTSGWAVGHGVALAFFTCGISLIGSGLAARRISIASQKLEIVTAELKRRNIPLYKLRKRDYAIPIVVCLASLGLGIGTTIASLDVTSQSTAEFYSNSAGAVVDEATAQPTEFASDVAHGVEVQVEQVVEAVTPGGDLAHEATAAANEAIIEQTAAGMDPAGLALGLHIAQAAEVHIVQEACVGLAYCFRGSDEDGKEKQSQVCTLTSPENCKHNRYMAYCVCMGCETSVNKSAAYYHCCACHRKGYLFNVCEMCFTGLGWKCKEPEDHVLYRVAVEDGEHSSEVDRKQAQVVTEVREIHLPAMVA